MKARGVRSLMDVPIWVRSELAGILCHEHTSPRDWSEAEAEFALAVSHSLSATLEARQRCGAEAAEERSAFMAEVSCAPGASLDQDEVARRAVELAVPRLADWAVLDILDNDRGPPAGDGAQGPQRARNHEGSVPAIPAKPRLPALHLAGHTPGPFGHASDR